MGSAKSQLVQQRRAKIAVLKPARAVFAEQMAQKRQLRQLFKREQSRRRFERIAAPAGTRAFTLAHE